MAAPVISLVQREAERDQLASAVAGVRGGQPVVVTLHGPPGSGAGALLRRMAALATRHGLAVWRVGTRSDERHLPYAAVGRLVAAMTGEGWAPATPLPGLRLVLRRLRSGPAVLLVENGHWLDAASRVWFEALVRRLPTAPVALVVTGDGADRPGWPGTAAAPGVVTVIDVPLRRLDAAGVATAVEAVCGMPGDEPFRAAAGRLTDGRHDLLTDLLHRFASRDLAPYARNLPVLTALADLVTGEHVARTLRGLPDDLVEVLRVVAAAGGRLDLALVDLLCGGVSAHHACLTSTLQATGLVTVADGVPRTVGPFVTAHLLAGLTPGERAGLYGRAARLARTAAVPDEAVAALLEPAPSFGESWVPDTLRSASAAAARAGRHHDAARWLARALEEPLPPHLRARVTVDLAGTEAVTSSAAGDRRLAGVLRLAGPEFAGLRAQAADRHLARGDAPAVLRLLTCRLGVAESAERAALVALGDLADMLAPASADLAVPSAPRVVRPAATPAQAGALALRLALRGEDRRAVRELAGFALTGEDFDAALVMPRLAACRALLLTEDIDAAHAELDRLVARGDRSHDRSAAARVHLARAELHLLCGRLDAAARDTSAAETALPVTAWHPLAAPQLIALQVVLSREAGDTAQARERAAAPPPPAAEAGPYWPFLLFARALVALDDQRLPEAYELLMRSGAGLRARQWLNPGVLPWRSVAARLRAALGDHDGARVLAAEELTRALHWGAAGPLACAQLAVEGLNPADRPDRDATLRRAALLTGISPSRLACGWALAQSARHELGHGERGHATARLLATGADGVAALWPAGRLATALAGLRRQLDDAMPPAAGQPGEPERITTELLTAELGGTRPEWRELSEAERLTATLAGRGYRNRQIAEALSVSERTVELRLSAAYRTLRVGGRAELRTLIRTWEGGWPGAART